MRAAALALVVFALLFGGGQIGSAEPPHPFGAVPIVVTLEIGGCTGFMVGPRTLLTAGHCARRVGEAVGAIFPGQRLMGVVLATTYDPGCYNAEAPTCKMVTDAAVVRLFADAPGYLRMATADPVPGDYVVIPNHQQSKVSHGQCPDCVEVGQVERIQILNTGASFAIDTYIDHGGSGAPVLNQREEVVGIVSRSSTIYRNPDGTIRGATFASFISDARRLLETVESPPWACYGPETGCRVIWGANDVWYAMHTVPKRYILWPAFKTLGACIAALPEVRRDYPSMMPYIGCEQG